MSYIVDDYIQFTASELEFIKFSAQQIKHYMEAQQERDRLTFGFERSVLMPPGRLVVTNKVVCVDFGNTLGTHGDRPAKRYRAVSIPFNGIDCVRREMGIPDHEKPFRMGTMIRVAKEIDLTVARDLGFLDRKP